MSSSSSMLTIAKSRKLSKKIRMIQFGVGIALYGWVLPLGAAGMENVGLEECLRLAWKNRLEFKGYELDQAAAAARVSQNFSAYYPQADLETSYNQNLYNRNDEYRLNLDQLLFDFGRTSLQIDISRFDKEISRLALKTAMASIRHDVQIAYYACVRDQETIRLQQENREVYQSILIQAEAFYQAGRRSQIDVVKARIDENSAELNIIQTENTLKNDYLSLEQMMGIEADEMFSVPPEALFSVTLPVPERADPILHLAWQNNAELQGLKQTEEQQGARLELSKKEYWPELKFNSQYYYAWDESLLGYGRNWTIKVYATLSLFNGFYTPAKVEENTRQHEKILNDLAVKRLEIKYKTQKTLLDLQHLNREIVRLREVISLAEKNLVLARKRYAENLNSITELSDSAALLYAKKKQLLDLIFAYKSGQFDLELISGTSTF